MGVAGGCGRWGVAEVDRKLLVVENLLTRPSSGKPFY